MLLGYKYDVKDCAYKSYKTMLCLQMQVQRNTHWFCMKQALFKIQGVYIWDNISHSMFFKVHHTVIFCDNECSTYQPTTFDELRQKRMLAVKVSHTKPSCKLPTKFILYIIYNFHLVK